MIIQIARRQPGGAGDRLLVRGVKPTMYMLLTLAAALSRPQHQSAVHRGAKGLFLVSPVQKAETYPEVSKSSLDSDT